jgi:hypothetical protein
MDFLKKSATEFTSKSEQPGQQPQQQTATTGGAPSGTTTAAPAQTQDYGDKGESQTLLSDRRGDAWMDGANVGVAFDFISKKAGHDLNPETDEKVTDGARGLYEKFSG